MPKTLKSFPSLLILAIFYFSFSHISIRAADFDNPLLKTPNSVCTANNLRNERFDPEVNINARLKICQAINKITIKLNANQWSPTLMAELTGIWRVFAAEKVTLRLMPKGSSSRLLAMAEAFPFGSVGKKFEACVYLRPSGSDDEAFFQVLLHELRHVYDFYGTWQSRGILDTLEVERRAFLLMGKISQETNENVSGVPKFWNGSWRSLSAEEISRRRADAVKRYLRGNSFYREFSLNNAQALDFSYLKKIVKSDNESPTFKSYDKDDVSLPNRQPLPKTDAQLPQNIQELDFELEKPKNPRDEREILRVALRNEKKLYYGMQNFVYEQKLAFQCWQKGKVSTSYLENNTVSRTASGNALLQSDSPQFKTAVSPCVLDSQGLKTDFTETFWASPALEKMPITFAGFVEADGQTLARYTVLQPDAKLFNELSNQYGYIKSFRVFVGTIFVSPADGQIVKFWGTSFPENTVTGSRSQKVWGSYSVTAVRQKLNIKSGLWVTVYIGTVAVAKINGNSRPFSYTVNFENYRQSKTDVRVLDDDAVASNSPVGSR